MRGDVKRLSSPDCMTILLELCKNWPGKSYLFFTCGDIEKIAGGIGEVAIKIGYHQAGE